VVQPTAQMRCDATRLITQADGRRPHSCNQVAHYANGFWQGEF